MCGYICCRTPGCLGLAGHASFIKIVTVIFHAGVIAAIVVVVIFVVVDVWLHPSLVIQLVVIMGIIAVGNGIWKLSPGPVSAGW